jgi:conjugative transfer signal peptidase TraF
MIRRISILSIAALTALSVTAVIGRVRIITTNSAAPAGIYRTVAAPLTRGELVLACLPSQSARLALQRGYLGAGDCPNGVEPVAKIIGALPGDSVEIQPLWIAINGIRIPRSSTAARDTMGRSLSPIFMKYSDV